MSTQVPNYCVRIEHGDGPLKEIVSSGERLVIGRGPPADLVIDDPNVSAIHCEIARETDDFVLRDLGSAHGTWVSGVRVREVVLPAEAHFEIGNARLSFGQMGDGSSAEHLAALIETPFKIAKARIVSAFEREYLTAIMGKHGGNITAAAHAAGLDRVHFLRLLDRYGLRKTRSSRPPPKTDV